MPQGKGYSSFSSFGRKKKKDEEPLKKKKKFPTAGGFKKDIQSREDKVDEALRKAGVSEAEIRQLRGVKEKKKEKK